VSFAGAGGEDWKVARGPGRTERELGVGGGGGGAHDPQLARHLRGAQPHPPPRQQSSSQVKLRPSGKL